MRRFALITALAFVLFGGAAAVAGFNDTPVFALSLTDLQQPAPDIQVDIDMDRGGGAWYANPVWLAIGGLAILVVILLVVTASRGSGTTIVKD